MNPSRLFLFVAAGCCCLLRPASLPAQESPFNPSKQFSADMVITTAKGQNITQKMYGDNGKMRMEMNMLGNQMVMIVRPDLQKFYQVMPDRKMVMEMPYDPDRIKNQMAAATGPQGKFEAVGPDTVEGVACTKYKVTSDKDNKVFFFWVDAATKAPVKMMAEDNSIVILWKNYKTGAQEAALFVPPPDFKVMSMPAMPKRGP